MCFFAMGFWLVVPFDMKRTSDESVGPVLISFVQ